MSERLFLEDGEGNMIWLFPTTSCLNMKNGRTCEEVSFIMKPDIARALAEELTQWADERSEK